MKSKSLTKIIFILIVIIICHNSLVNNQPASNISGRILDKNTKSPISDVCTQIFRLFVIGGIGEKIHVTRDILDCREVANSSLLRISFSHFVGFDYFHYSGARETRMLRLDQGYAYIDTLGNIYGPITKRGIWSKERLADLLPYDYNPNE